MKLAMFKCINYKYLNLLSAVAKIQLYVNDLHIGILGTLFQGTFQ